MKNVLLNNMKRFYQPKIDKDKIKNLRILFSHNLIKTNKVILEKIITL